ncbi:MBL fold metallo-hydrolase [Dysgonomonas sp. ZJ709]|uniref:MBL fold metallo-hydrolase n=1 Tax=Dysgonomonas sp. ZJ709 TaxID=2709797 RepID=UPI0013EC135D|nr:MBL fold metallo-hydrolase [Dysgonomonas sp. ZJ709]
MKVKFLGTGTSTGNPEIGCRCEVCTSNDKKDRRLRASVLIGVNGKRILIDCGPDFREQILGEEFTKIHGVLITHEHYDHVGGLDDLRPYCKLGDIEIYSNKIALDSLRARIPYCFNNHPYPGIPVLHLNEVASDKPFLIEGVEVLPINIIHYKLPIYGYRIQDFAYLTDVKHIPEEEYDKLKNLEVLVIDALRIKEHLSHENLEQALENIRRIAPQKAYLIHMSHQIGLHAEVQKDLPENVFLSYDGLELEF